MDAHVNNRNKRVGGSRDWCSFVGNFRFDWDGKTQVQNAVFVETGNGDEKERADSSRAGNNED